MEVNQPDRNKCCAVFLAKGGQQEVRPAFFPAPMSVGKSGVTEGLKRTL